MRKISRVITINATIIIMLCLNFTFIYAEEHTDKAEFLKQLGLFEGTNKGYELDSIPTRAQAAVMIVRLLGDKDIAIDNKYSHPFTDVPSWADPYIGYMWYNGLAKGKSDTMYGANDLITDSEYMTFLLRILGYNDKKGDFNWKTSIDKASEIGLFGEAYYSMYKKNSEFTRDDMVLFSYLILDVNTKNVNNTLLEVLIDKEVVPKNSYVTMKLYEYTNMSEAPTYYDEDKIREYIEKALYNLEDKVIIKAEWLNNTNKEFGIIIDDAISEVSKIPAYSSVIDGWSTKYYSSDEERIINITYRIEKNQFKQAMDKGKEIVSQIINNNMTEYEKELAIHDYIIDNTIYDNRINIPKESYTMYGALVLNETVCHGYAESFFYLSYLANLKSEIVFGDGIDQNGNKISHAWNIVSIGGSDYQIDLTWNDPVDNDGKDIKSYKYFNITDDDMAIDHIWEINDYDECSAKEYNYYVYNDLVAYNYQQLKEFINNGLKKRQTEIVVKMIDSKITLSDLKNILNELSEYRRLNYLLHEDFNIVEITNISY